MSTGLVPRKGEKREMGNLMGKRRENREGGYPGITAGVHIVYDVAVIDTDGGARWDLGQK
jgi:hypothetical protein